MYALFVLIFLRPFYLSPLFILPFSTPLYLYALFVLIFVHLYFYASIFTLSLITPLSFYLLLLSSLYVHIIYTPFSQKIFPKKISTPKAYPKIFTYYNYSSPLLFNRKVNSSYSFYKILNTKFWRLYETIKTNGKNYYDFG